MSYFEKTTKLPNRLFKVRVPIIATYTEEEMKVYGLPVDITEGKPNKETFKEMTVAMFNLDKIIDMYINGYPIYIVNPNDSKEIFKILEEYIAIQNNKVSHSLNTPTYEEKRLHEIDKFVSEMFGYNKNTIVQDIIKPTNGYAIDFGLMHTPGTITNNPFGVHDLVAVEKEQEDGYRKVTEYVPRSQQNQHGYQQPNLPNIDMSTIERQSAVKPGFGNNNFGNSNFTLEDLNKLNKEFK